MKNAILKLEDQINKRPLLVAFVILLIIYSIFKVNSLMQEKAVVKVHIKTYDKMDQVEQHVALMSFCNDNERMIKDRVEEAVSGILKAPSSASFSPEISFTVDQYITKQIVAHGWVDAENSYGAMLRTKYMCRFAIPGNGEIEIQKTVLDE